MKKQYSWPLWYNSIWKNMKNSPRIGCQSQNKLILFDLTAEDPPSPLSVSKRCCQESRWSSYQSIDYDSLTVLADRKFSIGRAWKLDPQPKEAIEQAEKLAQEELWPFPYKEKRRTKATIAWVQDFSTCSMILQDQKDLKQQREEFYLKISITVKDAISGAISISLYRSHCRRPIGATLPTRDLQNTLDHL